MAPCPLDAPPVLRDSYNREVAKYESYLDVNAKLLQAIIIIVSVLPEDMMALRDPVFGDLLLTIPVVLAHVKMSKYRRLCLARLRHCGDTSGPLQGQRVHSREQDETSKQTRVECEREEEE